MSIQPHLCEYGPYAYHHQEANHTHAEETERMAAGSNKRKKSVLTSSLKV
jgi:hypothetical protein